MPIAPNPLAWSGKKAAYDDFLFLLVFCFYYSPLTTQTNMKKTIIFIIILAVLAAMCACTKYDLVEQATPAQQTIFCAAENIGDCDEFLNAYRTAKNDACYTENRFAELTNIIGEFSWSDELRRLINTPVSALLVDEVSGELRGIVPTRSAIDFRIKFLEPVGDPWTPILTIVTKTDTAAKTLGVCPEEYYLKSCNGEGEYFHVAVQNGTQWKLTTFRMQGTVDMGIDIPAGQRIGGIAFRKTLNWVSVPKYAEGYGGSIWATYCLLKDYKIGAPKGDTTFVDWTGNGVRPCIRLTGEPLWYRFGYATHGSKPQLFLDYGFEWFGQVQRGFLRAAEQPWPSMLWEGHAGFWYKNWGSPWYPKGCVANPEGSFSCYPKIYCGRSADSNFGWGLLSVNIGKNCPSGQTSLRTTTVIPPAGALLETLPRETH